eukprot:CAMPEP_0116060680 /NCGR_PEP_ID=MMETSP0322-20121206/6569_1 /TAXON_ID=163516 /ORGANISM="Leptocylindrus danicus var. apora, Strain B651" /LENGTH=228 /DNA_ID=CAMNT_0003545365 /DNA_START=71 /DNA_END=757 /DNA_ORIENTATION=+
MSSVDAAFSSPHLGLGALLFKPKGMTVRSVRDSDNTDSELYDAGKFFADAFWTGKGGSKVELSSAKKKTLERNQMADFRRRYGNSLNAKSDLFIAQSSNGEIMGCAGLEVDLIKPRTSRENGIKAPLMSNVAVGKKFRRKGIAEDLVKCAEKTAVEWGYTDLYLLVERKNVAAVKLYMKAGYKKIWEDNDARTLIPTKTGLQLVPTVTTCMRKRLVGGGGFFSNFLTT